MGAMQVGEGKGCLLDILSLAKELPPVLQAGSRQAAQVAPVTFRFTYFRNTEAAEHKLESSPELAGLDRQYQQVGSSVLQRPLTSADRSCSRQPAPK